MRRPTPAFILALVALFIAVGGPAQAARLINGKQIKKGTVTGKQIKNRSLGAKELTAAARAALTAVPLGSVGAAQLVPGAVGPAQLAAGAVGTGQLAAGAVGRDQLADGAVDGAKLADGAVGAAEVPDGVLGAPDVGRFAGALTGLDFGTVTGNGCKGVVTTSLTALAADQDLRDDAIVVTPAAAWPDTVTLVAKPFDADQIEVVACNQTGADIALGAQTLRYVSFDT